MGVTNIQDAKLLIQSSKVKERTAGLKDLIHILKHNRGKPSLEALGNKAYLALCETLFQCLHDQRAAYLRDQSKATKKHALLPVSASALRQVIATGVRTIKSSTVEITIDAIIENLPDADGVLIQPLLEDLPKTLRSLLEYQPHVERLSKDCWDAAVDFCINAVTVFCTSDESEDGHQSWSTSISSRARTPLGTIDVTSSRASPRPQPPRQRSGNDDFAHATEDFIFCLQSLARAPNAPVLEKSESLLRVLLQFLQRRTGRSSTAAAALAAINALLGRHALQSVDLVKHTVTELLPLMKPMWSELMLREELMVTLTYAEPHISSLLADPDNELISSDLEALVETIYGDYRKRQDTTAHHFLEEDHLSFRCLALSQKHIHPLHAGSFSMTNNHSRFEALYLTVSVIARFSTMLDHRRRLLVNHQASSQESFHKRSRVTHLFHEYLRHILEPRSNAKRAALQVVTFMAHEGPFEVEDLESILEKLIPVIADENPVHAVWAMIGLAEFALQQASADQSLKSLWISAWQASSRTVTSASTCRAACNLMNILLKLQIVSFSVVTDFVQSMLHTIELSGPALLADSSAALLITVMQERVQENPTNFSSTAERTLSWIFSKWTPGVWFERAHSNSFSHHSEARDVLQLLYTCLDKACQKGHSMTMFVLGPLAQARATVSDFGDLAHYLLLLENDKEFLRDTHDPHSATVRPISEGHLTPMEARVVEFCRSEVEKSRVHLEDLKVANVQGITIDMLRTATDLCIIARAITSLADPDDHRIITLQESVQILTESVATVLKKPQLEQYKVDSVLETCTKSLPDIDSSTDFKLATFHREGLDMLAIAFSYALKERQDNKQSFYAEDDDFMDIDEDDGSQPLNTSITAETDVPRQETQAANDISTLRASCTAYLHLIASLQSVGDDHEKGLTSFIDHLITVHENDLLRLRSFLRSLWSTRLRISKLDCLNLLERCSEALVDPCAREYNTSEVANGMLVEVLIGATSTWELDPTDSELQDLYENVEALYAYYVKGMEKGGVRRSPNLQKIIATFLHGLLRHRPDFAQNRKVPSVRTSLFDLLSRGDIRVKHHIALQLPAMFEDFILAEHEKILQDVDSSLPGKSGGLEGIAVRLLVLSKLASQWHTLLRPAVYLIFAIAGSMTTASQHAKRCISVIARSRGLESPQSLFRLFASQIIYSWLDEQNTFAQIPFTIFGYPSITALLGDIKAEATGQAMMRGHKKELQYLAEQLEVEVSDLLLSNMGKAAAYTIAWDTCNGASRDKTEASNSNLLRDLVGADKYFTALSQHFPDILGCMFQTSDHEERVGEALERKTAFHAAAQRLSEITNISQSEQVMRIGMQPAFSAFYIPDQLERLCRRTAENASSFWSAGRYSSVLRSVLDRIHPALGSLYARSMIRKVRIIVALAGSVAFEGYPLQMTLQSLRPFLTDAQCAEDATGIMQYLFKNGTHYLRQQLGFMTGIGLSILISLRVFMGASQESTTQQSQHIATMNAATRFHTWFSDYLFKHAAHITGVERTSFIKAFSSITTTASRVQAEGNSVRGSEESKLLLEILDDVRTGRRLLNKTSREVALDLLCRNFRPALMARDDILGADEDAANYAPLVWESCQRPNVGDGYLLWSAKVLGRAYSANGEVQRITGQSKPWKTSTVTTKDSLGRASRDAIIKEVIGVLNSDNHAEVSLAEGAVRSLLARLEAEESGHTSEIYRNIPETISAALRPHNPDAHIAPVPERLDKLHEAFVVTHRKSLVKWIQELSISLCEAAAHDPVLGALIEILRGLESMAEKLLPYLIHLVLLIEFDTTRHVAGALSAAMMTAFQNCEDATTPYVRVYVQSILYLRSQPVPHENVRVDRDRWLQIDFLEASRAACVCGMYRSALLLAETSSGHSTIKAPTRRSSIMIAPPKVPMALQLSIYKNLDEPDSFYGVQRESTLLSVLDRLEYEGDGIKSLLFRGARLDSQMRRANKVESADRQGTIKSLIMLNMNGITNSLLSNDQFRDVGHDAVEGGLSTARKLNQWDVRAPELNHSESSTLFKAFQGLHFAKSAVEARSHFERQLLVTMNYATEKMRSSLPIKTRLRTLAVLTEADEVIESDRSEHLLDTWDHMKAREKWMRAGEFNDVRQILSCRESLFSTLGTNTSLLSSLHVRAGTVRNMESESLVTSSSICRKHGALPEALASVTYLSDIVPECKSVGLDIEAIAMHEVANVLWEQGEAEISIRMREHLIQHTDFDSQKTDLSKSVLQARLGHHLAEARLAKPHDIMQNYLEPAISELKGQKHGTGPGQVFHEFALFCDRQIQSPEAAEDMERIRIVMDRKLQEYHEFIKLAKTDKSKSMRDTYARSARRAKGWYDLDNAEYERLRKGRENFLRQCLENYLSSLAASDEYDNDALRVFSLWLEYAETDLANDAVESKLKDVPSGKFALLMNQLSSRLQSEESQFQKLLVGLVTRICIDHPYHGMHQIFAIQMKVGAYSREDVVRAKDESARSRQKAAIGIANALSHDKRARSYWSSIFQSNEIYHHLAMFKGEKESTQQGRDIPLDRYKESRDLVQKVPKLNVPPATLQVEVRPNMNYTDLPRMSKFKSTMSIANGLSAPKVITAIGTDGKSYKQLFKSGNDDLRQDAIMEQVFDQVSRLLKNHTATRIRNLGIRTYKVLPLSTRSGLMEFVQNTVPLHMWVMPAHERYYPSDYKPDRCRKEINNCQQDSLTTRIKVWQKVADNFHPVMRYFLLERFEDPDEWFERRLAYTRSTAAISILGHVLGLGDRHCHNILLDEKSGEIVHIDLGVSFEAGRVLPVPEVVPFRLTRDLVDAMGFTKTEGVFRRCCEFTLDTLREERESIMTLLNVLRYDPLVNWSVTPNKAKRMQEANQDTNNPNNTRGASVAPGGTPAPTNMQLEEIVQESAKKKDGGEDQAGEAGRALSVVEKKLSKTLSTKAMVNELIQQATDDKNLAVLYMGWASYA